MPDDGRRGGTRSWTEYCVNLNYYRYIINLFAIEQWTFGIVLYPAYILIAEGIVVFLLLKSRLKMFKRPEIFDNGIDTFLNKKVQ